MCQSMFRLVYELHNAGKIGRMVRFHPMPIKESRALPKRTAHVLIRQGNRMNSNSSL